MMKLMETKRVEQFTTMLDWTRLAATGVILWVAIAAGEAHGATVDIGQLVGDFVGVSVTDSRADMTVAPPDIHLEVHPSDRGFVLSWQSLAETSEGKKHHYKVVFERTRRPGIFRALMRCNVFGHARPLDPMRGEPYAWIYLEENGLTLYAMSIDDNGSHDLSIYQYRLDGDQMKLEFERVRNNRPVLSLQAIMHRTRPESRVNSLDEVHGSPNCD